MFAVREGRLSFLIRQSPSLSMVSEFILKGALQLLVRIFGAGSAVILIFAVLTVRPASKR
jgi:hypothetical protein